MILCRKKKNQKCILLRKIKDQEYYAKSRMYFITQKKKNQPSKKYFITQNQESRILREIKNVFYYAKF